MKATYKTVIALLVIILMALFVARFCHVMSHLPEEENCEWYQNDTL